MVTGMRTRGAASRLESHIQSTIVLSLLELSTIFAAFEPGGVVQGAHLSC